MQSAPTVNRILIVDDDESQLRTLSDIFVDEGFDVVTCKTYSDGLQEFRKLSQFSLAIIDLRIAAESGVGLLEKVNAERPDIRCIIHTAYGSFDTARDAINLGVFAYVEKLGDPRDLIHQVHRAKQAAIADALHASERRFQDVVSLAPIAIQELDLECKFLWVNPAGTKMANVTSQKEIIGRYFLDFVHANDKTKVQNQLQAAIAGQSCEIEFNLIDASTTLASSFVPIQDSNGTVVKLLGVSEDITEKAAAKNAIIKSQRSLAKAQEVAKIANLTWDFPRNQVLVSDQMFKILGQKTFHDFPVPSSETSIAPFLDNFVHPDDRRLVMEAYLKSLKLANTDSVEFRIIRSDQQIRFLIAEYEIEFAEDGSPLRLIGTVQDITARKNGEEAQRQQERKLAHVGRLATMGEMVAGIAHEINQPLFSITNFASSCELMLQRSGDQQIDLVSEWVSEISDQASRAAAIIRRLANFVRNDDPLRENANLQKLIAVAVQITASEAKESAVMVEIVSDQEDVEVVVDGVQIQQVLVNLIRNAIEALNDSNEIGRKIRIRSRIEDNHVHVEVEDNGPGLSEDVKDGMFDAFNTTKPGGMGMGLAICRSIVESHGGRLSCTTNLMKGATFTFCLRFTMRAPCHV